MIKETAMMKVEERETAWWEVLGYLYDVFHYTFPRVEAPRRNALEAAKELDLPLEVVMKTLNLLRGQGYASWLEGADWENHVYKAENWLFQKYLITDKGQIYAETHLGLKPNTRWPGRRPPRHHMDWRRGSESERERIRNP